jgi:catechol 2,3-dioxygenase-like lactoylglutathione lyase family enzyme
MRITGAHHTSYTVADLHRSLAFYVGLFGCEVIWQREIRDEYFRQIVGLQGAVVRAAQLRIPGSQHVLELFEYVEPRGTPADIANINPGSSHIAWFVDDLPTAYEELRAQGVTFRSPPVEIDAGANRGGWAAYALDPDGITVELFQPPRPDGGIGAQKS